MSDLSFLLYAGGAVLLIVFLVIVAAYVLSSLAASRVLKIYGYKNAWMAWIPVLNFYALGDAAVPHSLAFGGVELPAILFKVWWLLSFAVGYIPEIGSWLSLAVQIFFLGSVITEIYAAVEGKKKEDVRILGYLSGWIPIISWIKFLTYDKAKRIAEPEVEAVNEK